ncbi:MAG: thioredoxin family protein [Bacteroidaceae bacterium]|nr:thioredoxin family protein [Bacteroidaceae bacterium]
MRQLLFGAFMLLSIAVHGQTGLPRVYDETIDTMIQIDNALKDAKSSGRFVVCQLGGNWCPWCLRFADFVAKDSIISKTVADNFVYIHVNYNPRSASADAVKAKRDAELLQRLGSPARFGFPVFIVLDEQGRVLHIQDSSFLEEGKGYNHERVLRFFQCWTPAAVKGE